MSAARHLTPAEARYRRAKLEAVRAARRRILPYTRYTFPAYVANWHHRQLCEHLDWWLSTPGARLIVCMPPRHGKSELVTRRLSSFVTGSIPGSEVIVSSYSQDLARRMSRDARRIVRSRAWQELFPDARLSSGNDGGTNTSDLWQVMHRNGKISTLRAAGVGVGITGMGATHAVIDDPLKDWREAYSVRQRDAVWEWYTSTLYTRLAPGGRVLVTVTRWHEDDLVGRLLTQANEDGDEWRTLVLPAVCENEDEDSPRSVGDALWPERYDLEYLRKIKALSERVYRSLYQQRPTREDGDLFKRGWLNYYDVMPSDFDQVLISGDLTFKDSEGADYVALHVWGRRGSKMYLLDRVHDRMAFTETVRALKQLAARWPNAYTKLIEEKANGAAVINTLEGEVGGLTPINPTDSKMSRANAASCAFEAGDIYLPDESIAPWVGEVVEELCAFPNGANDDDVDATTQAINYWQDEGPSWIMNL